MTPDRPWGKHIKDNLQLTAVLAVSTISLFVFTGEFLSFFLAVGSQVIMWDQIHEYDQYRIWKTS